MEIGKLVLSDCKNNNKTKRLSAFLLAIYLNEYCEFQLILLDCTTYIYDFSDN